MTRADPPAFVLDPRLAADGPLIVDWPACRIHLKDDSRFPWLVLVPRIAGAVELFDLAEAERAAVLDEVMRSARAMKALWPDSKINVAALGNIVRQLHIHVVVRHEGDAAWPGAPWIPDPRPYGEAERATLIGRLRAALGG